MLLKGKTALVTGARRGIGRQIVRIFAENGADIWACARTPCNDFESDMKNLAQHCDVTINPLYFELTEEDEIKVAMKQVMSSKQAIDILVNNAGIMPEPRLFSMLPLDDIRKTFEVNFFSQLLITQYISRMMARKKSGSIVNIVSFVAIDGGLYPGHLDYVASKAALIGVTKKLAIEMGEQGIRVNAIAPGPINTDMGQLIQEDFMQKILQRTSLKRAGTANDVAGSVLFLASDLSSHITGQIIRVDGGLL